MFQATESTYSLLLLLLPACPLFQAIESTYSPSYDRVYLGTLPAATASPLLPTSAVADVMWARDTSWALVFSAFYRMLTLGESSLWARVVAVADLLSDGCGGCM